MTRESVGRELMREALEAVPPDARPRLRRVLSRYIGTTIYIPRDPSQARQEAACNMLGHGVAPPDVAAALVERFGISRATAGRDLMKARRARKLVGLHPRISSVFRISRKTTSKIDRYTAL